MSKADDWLNLDRCDLFQGRAKGNVIGDRKRWIGRIVEYNPGVPGLMLHPRTIPADTAMEFARWILDTFGEKP